MKVVSDVYWLFFRKERSVLCPGIGKQQTADSHHLQNPQPGVEKSLHFVSVSIILLVRLNCQYLNEYAHICLCVLFVL